MTYSTDNARGSKRRGRVWRVAVVAGLSLLLCSCQSMRGRTVADAPSGRAAAEVIPASYVVGDGHDFPGGSAASQPMPYLPAEACPVTPSAPWALQPAPLGCPPTGCPPAAMGVPCPALPCAAAQAVRPWVADEYVCDGGDAHGRVKVARDWTVRGLEQEDTVVHYDTLAGETEVQPSTRVCIYAPRFAAVRKISGILQHEQHERMAGIELPVGPSLSGSSEVATTVLQPVEPRGQRGIKFDQSFRERTRTVGVENLAVPATTEWKLLPWEDFLVVRRGQFDNSEKARLAARLQAAVIWTQDKAVQVVIDDMVAVESLSHAEAESVYVYELPLGKPRLRVVKLASTDSAQPGDSVYFTIRFDNVGDQVIGNVTVLDSLSTRLEYVADSQECSIPAEFSASANEAESQLLRWEITDPLEVGQGGVIRFQCRVR